MSLWWLCKDVLSFFCFTLQFAFFLLHCLFFRAVLGSQQNEAESVCPLPLHMYSVPPVSTSPTGAVQCDNGWPYVDTSLLCTVHSSHQGSFGVLSLGFDTLVMTYPLWYLQNSPEDALCSAYSSLSHLSPWQTPIFLLSP